MKWFFNGAFTEETSEEILPAVTLAFNSIMLVTCEYSSSIDGGQGVACVLDRTSVL